MCYRSVVLAVCEVIINVFSQQNDIAAGRQPVSVSWCQALSGAHDRIFVTFRHLLYLSLWSTLSDKGMGLSFVCHSMQQWVCSHECFYCWFYFFKERNGLGVEFVYCFRYGDIYIKPHIWNTLQTLHHIVSLISWMWYLFNVFKCLAFPPLVLFCP